MQMRNASAYKKVTQLQIELKIQLVQLNTFLYEVMRDRDANRPIPTQIFITVAQASEFYPVVTDNKINIDNLLSADGARSEPELNRIRRATQGKKKTQLSGEMCVHFVTSLTAIDASACTRADYG